MRKGCTGLIHKGSESHQWHGEFNVIGENSALRRHVLYESDNDVSALSGAWVNNAIADWHLDHSLVRGSVSSREAFDAIAGPVQGFYYDKKDNCLLLHADFARQHPLFYYSEKNFFSFAPSVSQLIELLKKNDKRIEPDQEGAALLLTFASILGDKTLVKGIYKLLPGHSLEWRGGNFHLRARRDLLAVKRNLKNSPDAITQLSTAFEKATREMIQFAESCEVAQINLLSGGIDSRMVLFESIKHQPNVDVLCFSKRNYLDHQISEQIAKDLGLTYNFFDLQRGEYMLNTESVEEYDGTINYLASAHHRMALRSIDKHFGVVAAGQLGNEILAEYFIQNGTPERTFGSMLTYKAALALCEAELMRAWNQTPDSVIFKLYNRGFLYTNSAAYSTEDAVLYSPFTSSDFVETALALHPDLISNHHIYLQWMGEKYPRAQRYIWERYRTFPKGGLSLHWAKWKMKAMIKLFYARNNFKNASMTPVDEWYASSQQLREFFTREYKEHKNALDLFPQLKALIERDYDTMSVINKGSVLTLLKASKMYFNK
jgi:asparagine synthase (glutamine-hydrolysing)